MRMKPRGAMRNSARRNGEVCLRASMKRVARSSRRDPSFNVFLSGVSRKRNEAEGPLISKERTKLEVLRLRFCFAKAPLRMTISDVPRETRSTVLGTSALP